jgi:hypothetical protein
LIPFQGHLARPAASDPTQFEPVPAGRYDILFTLYAAPVGGESKVWGPERHAQVTVVNGLVNSMLGSVIGFQDVIAANPNFFARPLYVGITIDADGNPNTADLELVPRQALLPAVYALGALRADRLDGSDWRDFFVGTDNSGTFTQGTTKARDAEKLDGYDWSDVFQNGDPMGTILSNRIGDHSITGQKIASQTITASQLAPATITSNQIAPQTITEANMHPSLTTNSIIPPGTISAFAGPEANIPDGWGLCNGAAVRTNDYPGLFAAIGTSWGEGSLGAADDFSLPDLRGLFLRGVNGGRNDGWGDPEAATRTNAIPSQAMGNSGNQVGSLEADQFRTHNHDNGRYNLLLRMNVGESGALRYAYNYDAPHLYDRGGILPAGGTETRPRNAYVLYIIKY